MSESSPPFDVETCDAVAGMLRVPSGTVSAVVTDPPYCSGGFSEAGRRAAKGQGLRSETLSADGWFNGDNMGTAGLTWLLRLVAIESMRVLVEGGSLCMFCDWRMLPAIQPAIESAGLRTQNLVVWDKGSFGLGAGFRAQHELMIHLVKGIGRFYAADVGNVIRATRIGKEDREHWTQKPVELLRPVVRTVAPRGGLVLDPFAGSGSTGVACVAEGVRFLGFEIDRDIAITARDRLARATCTDVENSAGQRSLFAPESAA